MKQIQRTGFQRIYCITQIKSTFNSKLWIKSIFISKDKRILQTLGFNSSLHCNIFHRIAQYCTDHFVKAVWLWRDIALFLVSFGSYPCPAAFSTSVFVFDFSFGFALRDICVCVCVCQQTSKFLSKSSFLAAMLFSVALEHCMRLWCIRAAPVPLFLVLPPLHTPYHTRHTTLPYCILPPPNGIPCSILLVMPSLHTRLLQLHTQHK